MNSIFQQVFGARPAANVTWYNNTTPLYSNGAHDRIIINGKTVRTFNHKLTRSADAMNSILMKWKLITFCACN